MGLYLSVDDATTASFSYLGFFYFRNCMLEALGLPKLVPLENYDEWDSAISKSKVLTRHMRIFFRHSDCDGYLSPKTCKGILNFCLAHFKERDFDCINYTQYLDFIDVLTTASVDNKKVMFL